MKYITGASSFNIPINDVTDDWHQDALIRYKRLNIHGVNYEGAYDILGDEGLFDCSAFLQKHGFDVGTLWCAGRERAIVDVLYNYIVVKGKFPSHFTLRDTMYDVTDEKVETIMEYVERVFERQSGHWAMVRQWLDENLWEGINRYMPSFSSKNALESFLCSGGALPDSFVFEESEMSLRISAPQQKSYISKDGSLVLTVHHPDDSEGIRVEIIEL